MKLGYSLLTIKSVNDEQWILEGLATTPTPDRVDDVVEPKGAQFTLPVPFLWQHNRDQPIGNVIEAVITDEGIQVKIQLVKPSEVESPELKALLQKAWDSIKTGLVRGLSVGIRGLEIADIQGTWGVRFLKWDWYELSAVTIAANQEATITSIKSLCQKEFSEKKPDTSKEKSVPCIKPEIIQAAQPKTGGVKLFDVSESKTTGVKFA